MRIILILVWRSQVPGVVKIGSQVLCDAQGALNRGILSGLVEQVARLVTDGWQVLLVSSGAVAAGSGISASQLQRLIDPVVRKHVMYKEAKIK